MLKRNLSRLSVDNFFSGSTKKVRCETLLCSVSENFRWQKKFLNSRMGEYQGPPAKFYCLTVPKKFVGHSSGVSLVSDVEKISAEEGFVTFSVDVFCLFV